MQLKELLTREYSIGDIAALFHAEQFVKRYKLRFVTSPDVKLLPDEKPVVLVPLRTLSVVPFTFPFGKKVSARDALELRFRPLLGANEYSVNIISQVTRQKSNETAGTAWFVSKKEMEQLEADFGDTVIWPSPYIFASRVNGNGVVVCVYADCCCGMLFTDGEPKLYRWLPKEEGTADGMADELMAYGKEKFSNVDFSVFVTEPEKEIALQHIGDATLKLYKSAYGLNLSSVSLSAMAEADKFIDKIQSCSKLLTMFGTIFVIFSILLLCMNVTWRGSFTNAPEQLYETVLHEQSENPLSSAAQKLRAVNSGSSQSDGFEEHFKRIASVWQSMDTKPVIDEMRYSKERIQLEGTAAEASVADNFRKVLSAAGYNAVTENAQQVPNFGTRFTISLTEGKNR